MRKVSGENETSIASGSVLASRIVRCKKKSRGYVSFNRQAVGGEQPWAEARGR
jgi:hypothetical protein